jgi:hypothetical protein
MENDVTAGRVALRPGMRVEVATRFTHHWAPGFEIASVDDRGCRVRRVSDGALLPVDFEFPSIRPVVD